MNKEIPWSDPAVILHSRLLLDNYRKWTGKNLFEESLDDASNSFLLYQATFPVVSFGIENDPVVNYSNLKAQELWSSNWEELTSSPISLFIPSEELAERQRQLTEVEKTGITENYHGLWISKKGNAFQMNDGIAWSLIDELGVYNGQVIIFYSWEKRS